MAKKVIVFSQFTGGLSDDPAVGIKYSSAYLEGLDVRSSPSQMSVLPGMSREDNSVVKDLILNEVMASNGVIYAVGNQGYVYRRTTGAAWSVIGTLSSGAGGIDYRRDSDAIYITSNKTVSAIMNVVNGTPTLEPDKYAASYSTYDNTSNTGFNVAAYQSGSGQTTQINGTISEAANAKRYFQTDIEPVSKISVFVVNKSVDDFTLILHDGLNTELARATVTNANLNNNAWNDFVFSNASNGQVRLYPAPNARTYHIHMFSSVGDGSISSTAVNDLSTCDLQVWADRLVYPISGLHPLDRFLQYELIGNGNYISAWEPISDPPTNAEWQRLRLTVPMEYENVGLAHTNEYSIGAWGKTSTGTATTPQGGLLTFWDGLSDTYNYFLPVSEGTPQALHVYMNVAYYYAGGCWWAITSPVTQPVKQKQLPGAIPRYSTANTPITMYPYAATVQNGVQLLAWPGASTNPNINFGVYSWGALNKNYPSILTYDFLPSTGSKSYSASNNLRLGMVKAFDDGLLHLSWRDDQGTGSAKYGIDAVTNSSPPVAYAKYQSLIVDNGYAAKLKTGAYIEAYYPNLPVGATITLSYSIDRGTFVTDPNSYSTTNLWQGHVNYCRFDVTKTASGATGGSWRELQVQVEIRCPTGVTAPPVVPMVALVLDDNRERELK